MEQLRANQCELVCSQGNRQNLDPAVSSWLVGLPGLGPTFIPSKRQAGARVIWMDLFATTFVYIKKFNARCSESGIECLWLNYSKSGIRLYSEPLCCWCL